MRKKRLTPEEESTQYCVFCTTEMPFERIDATDVVLDDPAEWICVSCGSALLVNPPLQELQYTTA